MELIEGLAIGDTTNREKHPSREKLLRRPADPRAWHCRTVEEYRLFRYSSGYQGYEGGSDDLIENASIDNTEVM